jgi:hypothetical protein
MSETHVPPTEGLSREEVARIEVGQTTVSPGVARAVTAFFLVCIIAVPAVETVVPWATRNRAPTVWSKLTDIPEQMSNAVQTNVSSGSSTLWTRTLSANRATLAGLSGFETALEDESVLGQTLRPPAQLVLSRWLGAGNERVFLGRDRWLFFRPDLEYLTNNGFLEPDVIRRRRAAASEWKDLPQPDPRPAILAFHRQLAARGIILVVMPTPVKPGVHPEQLVASAAREPGVLQNLSYPDLVAWLRSQGIVMFDPADVLGSVRQSAPQYLATDTHWRPEAMELVAGRLAAFVSQHVALPQAPSPGLRIVEQEVTNAGDTAVMLGLPAGQTLYPPERVVISRTVSEDGSPWRSDQSADVLLLGDSFTNIYSLASMGWGDSAGLAEQLSYALGRPLDRLVQNDDGAFATRALLQRAGQKRLAGKRVVIWQFAARELATGDWKVME